jgi:hypothetical protein
MCQPKKIFCAFVLGLALSIPSHAQQQQRPISVVSFLEMCRANRAACIDYMWGVIDGGMMEETRAGNPHRYCTRGTPYLEVGDAYLQFLYSEQIKGNQVILAQPNIRIFLNFMDVQYRCSP